MYRFHTISRRTFALAMAAALCLSLTACKAKQDPSQSAASSVADPPAQSAMNPDVSSEKTPEHEITYALAQKGLDDPKLLEGTEIDLLISRTVGDHTLYVIRQTGGAHVGGTDNLMAGVWDETGKVLAGDVFTLGGDDAQYAVWQDPDEVIHVLLANVTVNHGWETSSVPLHLTFDGGVLQLAADLPYGFLYEGDPLPEGWENAILDPNAKDFWENLKASPYGGGLELYIRNSEFDAVAQTGEQWLYLGYLALDGLPLPLK